MIAPSIKGMALTNALSDLARLVDLGKLEDSALDARLEPMDRELLEGTIEPAFWYPVESQARILALLRDMLGAGLDDWLVDHGHRNAESLLDHASIASLVEGSKAFGERAGVALVKLSALIFNFSTWTYDGDDLSDFTVTVTEAEPFTDPLRYNAQGFIRYLASSTLGAPVDVTSERRSPDCIVFHGRRRA